MSSKNISDCIFATQHGDILTVTVHVLQNHVSPNVTDENGCSLLHWAAINQRYSVAVFLISQGADVNYAGGDLNETPLQWAIRSQYLPVIDLLIQKGGDLQHKSCCGYDALHLACHSANTNVVCLLLLTGANPSSLNNEGETIIFWFIQNRCDCLDIIRLLLKFQIDLFVTNKMGDNVLHSMFEVSASVLQKSKRAIDWHLCYTIVEWACKHPNRHDDFVDPNTIAADEHRGMAVVRSTGLFNAYQLLFGQKNSEGRSAYSVACEKKHQVIFRFIFDFFSYKLLNRYSVTVFSMALTISLFLCIHWFGWIMGLLLYGCLYLMHEFVAQYAVQPAMSRSSNGAAWGIILSLAAGHFIFTQSYISAAWGVLVLVFLCAICWSLWVTMMSTPRRVKPDRDRLGLHRCLVASQVHIDMLADTKLVEPCQYSGPTTPSAPSSPVGKSTDRGEQEDADERSSLLLRHSRPDQEPLSPPSVHNVYQSQPLGPVGVAASPTVWYDAREHYDEHFRLCSTCLINKSVLHSGTHCMYCDACTPELDHHCHFVDNCVGVGNRRIFVAFTFFASAGCLLMACLYHHAIAHHYCLNVRETVLVPDASLLSVFSSMYYYFVHEYALNKCAFTHRPTVFALMWTAVVMVVWIGLICLSQCVMVMMETTTYECAKGVQRSTTRIKSVDSMTAESAAERLVTFSSVTSSSKPIAEKASNIFCLFFCSPYGINHPHNNTSNKVRVGVRNLVQFLSTGVYHVTKPPPILLSEFDPDAITGDGMGDGATGSSSRQKAEEVSFSPKVQAEDNSDDLDSVDPNTPINRNVDSSTGKYTMRELSAMDRNNAKKL